MPLECAPKFLFVKVFFGFCEKLTSVAPASRSNLMIGPIVFPRTMESSTKTIFLPCTFSEMAPNFFATPSCRNLVLG